MEIMNVYNCGLVCWIIIGPISMNKLILVAHYESISGLG